MSAPRTLVLRTAGINCDGETVRALELAGSRVDLTHLKRILAEPARLDEYALVVIPGGFSYGDDVAAGRIFGLELRHGLARELEAFVARGGFVLGVCNGFQVLVEAELLEARGRKSSVVRESAPDAGAAVVRDPRDIGLYDNASNRFECRWVTLEAQDSACAWLAAGERWPVPIAHGEGRFAVRDAAALQRLYANRQVALRYVRSDGSPATDYPDNPNGSVDAIAGVCDPTGRVLGLMPHPERNVTPWNHPHWTRFLHGAERRHRTEGEGLSFYRHMVEAASGAPV